MNLEEKIQELSQNVIDSNEMLKGLGEFFLCDKESIGMELVEFQKIFKLHNTMIKSTYDLMINGDYRSCFSLLRTTLDSLLTFWLILLGKKYRNPIPYNIKPNESSKIKEARDMTFDKWVLEWKSKDKGYENVIDIKKGKSDDEIIVTKELEGLFEAKDLKEVGKYITDYYFDFIEYSPETGFLSDLPIIYEGDMYPDISKKFQKAHQKMYNKFLFFKGLVKNLKLNELIDDVQCQKIKVHYSFLSSFVHLTRNSINILDENDRYVKLLILAYLCKFQRYNVKILNDFLKEKTKEELKEDTIHHFKKLSEDTKFLWFIFDDPSDRDIVESENRKKLKKSMGLSVDENVIIYYNNPLERIKKINDF